MAINYFRGHRPLEILKGQNIPLVIHVKYVIVIPLSIIHINFRVPHHRNASVTARLLKTKNLLEVSVGLRFVGNPNFP